MIRSIFSITHVEIGWNVDYRADPIIHTESNRIHTFHWCRAHALQQGIRRHALWIRLHDKLVQSSTYYASKHMCALNDATAKRSGLGFSQCHKCITRPSVVMSFAEHASAHTQCWGICQPKPILSHGPDCERMHAPQCNLFAFIYSQPVCHILSHPAASVSAHINKCCERFISLSLFTRECWLSPECSFILQEKSWIYS